MTDPLRLLAVLPHPDDETLGLGGTLAKYSAEGVETYLVCATHGERGWFDSIGPNPGLEAVGKIRAAELQCAAEHLGLHAVSFLGYVDGDVDQAKPSEIIGRIVMEIRRIQPQVVVTFPPDGAYSHPDHIALSQFTAAAIVCAADPSFQVEAGHSAYRVSKFYYMVARQEVVDFVNEFFGGISLDVDDTTRTLQPWADWEITTRINVSKYLSTVEKAVHCHGSQLPGYGPLAGSSAEAVSTFLLKADFYRAFSLVNGGRQVETDLFDGLR